jgi:hypothetical protein
VASEAAVPASFWRSSTARMSDAVRHIEITVKQRATVSTVMVVAGGDMREGV